MIEIFVNKNQLYNFLILKEPVELKTDPIVPEYFRFYLPLNKILINSYRTYSTVELLTFRKRVKLWFRRNKKK